MSGEPTSAGDSPPVSTHAIVPASGQPGMAVHLAVLSRQGGREYNEDACGHWHDNKRLVCVVADGAGGMGGGDVASKLVVKHIIEQAAVAPLSRPDEVQDLLIDTNNQVLRHQGEREGLRHMHSTAVTLFIDLERGDALWGHAGDSRLYVFRDRQMLAHTRDHSLVQSLVDAGLLKPEQMRTHPKRSELQSALGTRPEHLMVSTASRAWTLRGGDAFLLCSDGLWEYVDEGELGASLAQAANPAAWLNDLEQRVLRNAAKANNPDHDNFSAIGVWVG